MSLFLADAKEMRVMTNQAPSWNDATRAFAGNKDVRFADINLSEAPVRENYSPGAGGWPTIRYFNAETGKDGAAGYERRRGRVTTAIASEAFQPRRLPSFM